MKSKLLTVLSLSILSFNSAFAAEKTWKENLDAGAKIMHCDEFSAKFAKEAKNLPANSKLEPDAATKLVHSTASRDELRKGGKLIRTAMTQWQKDKSRVLSKEDCNRFSYSIMMLWNDELASAGESLQNKSDEEKWPTIKAFELQANADTAILSQIIAKIYGKDSNDYKSLIKQKNEIDEVCDKFKQRIDNSTSWKNNLNLGLKTQNFQEINQQVMKLDGDKKYKGDKSWDSIVCTSSNRVKIKQSAKYLRQVLVALKKEDSSLPSRQELEQLCSAFAYLWHCELKEAEEAVKSKPQSERIEEISKFQRLAQQDSSVLVSVAQKVLGDKDPGYLAMKASKDNLDATLKPH